MDRADWTCVAIIPCLNESATIGRLVTAVTARLRGGGEAQRPAVLVVDDGSNDDTARVAEQAGARVLRHRSTQGKGTALQTGLRLARELGFAWALTLDGDGQHDPDHIPAFLERARARAVDLLVGNRMHDSREMPWVRRQVNRWMSRRLSQLVGRPLPDSQCGFRLIRMDAWARLELDTRHFEIESEMLVQFVAAGYEVDFVPVAAIYKSERSKIHPLRDTWRWFSWLRTWRRQTRAAPGRSPRPDPARGGR